MKKLIGVGLLAAMLMSPAEIAVGAKTAEIPKNKTENIATEASEAYKISSIKIADTDISDYVIVRPVDASESEKFAAEELSAYIEKASGVKLEITDEASGDKVISVERDVSGELGTDGFIIRTENGKVTILGGTERGCLYGVYEFLESYIGWRFLTEQVEYLTTEGTVEIPNGIEDKQVPVLEYRHSYWTPYLRSQYAAAKRKLNVVTTDVKYGGAYTFTGGMVHTLGQLANGAHSTTEQPCLSDETVYQNVLANVLKILSENPNAKLISVSQDDNMNYCSCAECTRIAREEGVNGAERHSGPVLRFVNRIAEAVDEAGYTDVTIGTLAYTYSEAPPTITKARDNVMVQFCFYFNCFGHALDDPNCNENGGQWGWYFNNAARAENVKEWGKICKTIYVWDYATNYSYYPIIFPNFDVLAENIRFYVENNVKGVFSQGYELNHVSIEFGDLRAYLTAKLLWDPYMTDEEYQQHIDDFLQGYYGSGWEEIREYFDFVMESADKRNMHFHENAFALRLFLPMDYALHEEELEVLFDQAEAACTAAGETTQLQNIRYLRWGYEFMRLSSNYTANWEYGSEAVKAEYQADCKALYDAMVELDSYYDIGRDFRFREGYAPIFWDESMDYVLNLEITSAMEEWMPSNMKK